MAPCNGTVRLPPPCEDSPSSGSSKDRRDESPRRRCRLLAPVLFLVAVLLLGGLCLPFLLQSAPATHQQRLDVIRRILTEVPLIDGWAFVIRYAIDRRKWVSIYVGENVEKISIASCFPTSHAASRNFPEHVYLISIKLLFPNLVYYIAQWIWLSLSLSSRQESVWIQCSLISNYIIICRIIYIYDAFRKLFKYAIILGVYNIWYYTRYLNKKYHI